ncbi:hypothetical protein ACSS4C_003512 [Cronobacter sakazakii]|nr:hypothetical protein [Cronobacter sakazakii]MDI7683528.1 hypothetical protein [Cronobacter sakazakii]MDK1240774.1 hypothetical protein [Cronobacter sakazakii]
MMSSKIALGEIIMTLISDPIEMIRILIILTLGEVGRWLCGGGRLRERTGDLIISILLFALIRPHIISTSSIFGMRISSRTIAICIALVGSKGINRILVYIIKKRTGFDIDKVLEKKK